MSPPARIQPGRLHRKIRALREALAGWNYRSCDAQRAPEHLVRSTAAGSGSAGGPSWPSRSASPRSGGGTTRAGRRLPVCWHAGRRAASVRPCAGRLPGPLML